MCCTEQKNEMWVSRVALAGCVFATVTFFTPRAVPEYAPPPVTHVDIGVALDVPVSGLAKVRRAFPPCTLSQCSNVLPHLAWDCLLSCMLAAVVLTDILTACLAS